MNVSDEILFAFKDSYELKNGGFEPDVSAIQIAGMLGLSHTFATNQIREILMTPEVILYPDVAPFLQSIFADPNKYAKIWTQGQLSEENNIGYQEAKIKNCGLDILLRILNAPHQHIRNHNLYSVYQNKCVEVKPELKKLKNQYNIFAFIDDKADNLERMHEICKELEIHSHFIQIHRFSQEENLDPRFIHVKNLSEIDVSGSDMFFVDFDDTCIDHGLVKRRLTDRLIMWNEKRA